MAASRKKEKQPKKNARKWTEQEKKAVAAKKQEKILENQKLTQDEFSNLIRDMETSLFKKEKHWCFFVGKTLYLRCEYIPSGGIGLNIRRLIETRYIARIDNADSFESFLKLNVKNLGNEGVKFVPNITNLISKIKNPDTKPTDHHAKRQKITPNDLPNQDIQSELKAYPKSFRHLEKTDKKEVEEYTAIDDKLFIEILEQTPTSEAYNPCKLHYDPWTNLFSSDTFLKATEGLSFDLLESSERMEPPK